MHRLRNIGYTLGKIWYDHLNYRVRFIKDMVNPNSFKTRKRTAEAIISFPLSALRYLSRYPREKKIVVEISTDEIRRVNKAETLDEVINEARLDYALDNYKTFTSAKNLISDLHS